MKKNITQNPDAEKRSEEFSLKPITLEGEFPFKCYPGISCYNRCCKDTDILLTPYDILRLRQALGITCADFLQTRVNYLKLPGTEIPLVKLKNQEDEQASCIFLKSEGCSFYHDRPTVCRSYPIGFGLADKRFLEDHQKNFMIVESLCHGHREQQKWTLEQWKTDQQLENFDAFNQPWIELLVRLKTLAGKKLEEQQRSWFLMGCYDLDTFRQFVTQSSFPSKFAVPETRILEVESKDEALLMLALDWLKFMFFQEGPLKPKS
ncbi:MAG: YkgJ family cysteine cluster protein [SAR324 cluster bacterium]|jgi:hypothetical protein|nr:YkgJ family cysteine cluster protein [SAR324 cluster bacterium]MDP7501371.1 YkgJ family cysteine cluster protein [SAR324 cluster bacterium]